MVSGAQAAAIQGHWNSKVQPNMQAVGNALFLKYFAANPADKAHFKKFASVPDSGLAGNADFNAQTLVVMQYFDKMVAGLTSNAADLMKAQVAPHKARNVGAPEFGRMLNFIPGFIGENGGDGACVDAWKAAGAELLSVCK